jgi:organic hydroperoxide reductase OsmC/OhrA
MERTAIAIWRGGPDAGEGLISTGMGAIHKVVYMPRCSNMTGTEMCTTPGEMLAAAVAASVARKLAEELQFVGIKPVAIRAVAVARTTKKKAGYVVTRVDLEITAEMKGGNLEMLLAAAEKARALSPVAHALRVPTTIQVKLGSDLAIAA